jgi:clan AA aspartic protease (TIGR02281 family)
MSKMLAASVAIILPLAAPPANATSFSCSPPTIIVGDPGKNPTVWIMVNRDVASRWGVVHALGNGSQIDRSSQYDIQDQSVGTYWSWRGPLKRAPHLVMRGDLYENTAGQVVYRETLIDLDLNSKVTMQLEATCQQDRPPITAAAASPPPVPQQTPQNATNPTQNIALNIPDAVPIWSDGSQAIVDVNLNGDTFHFLIDTGATAMAVNPAVAAALISDGAASDAGTAAVTLADGRTVEERRIIIDKITLGTHFLFNIVATVNTTDGSANLLPFTILHQIGNFTIDTKNKLLVFG